MNVATSVLDADFQRVPADADQGPGREGGGSLGYVRCEADGDGRRSAVKRPWPGCAAMLLDGARRHQKLRLSLDVTVLWPVTEVRAAASEQAVLMPWAEGGSLATRLAVRPDLGAALVLAERVVATVARLHEVGAVHGNLKPTNVLFDADGVPHLADLALAGPPAPALALSFPPTVLPSIARAATYLAPELRRGRPAGPEADVYALGAILLELVLGRRPTASDEVDLRGASAPLEAALAEVVRAACAPVSSRLPHAPALLEAYRRALLQMPATLALEVKGELPLLRDAFDRRSIPIPRGGPVHDAAATTGETRTIDRAAEPPGTQVAGYRLVARAGAGGQGTVHRATNDSGAVIALKRPHPGVDPAPLLAAARAQAAVSGVEGVVTVIEVRVDPPAIAMEWVDGETLSEWAAASRGADAALAVCAELLAILERVHARGAVHGDLKPSNVLVTQAAAGEAQRGARGRLRITDFSAAPCGPRALSLSLGSPAGGALTFAYAAPELLDGAPPTARTDVYAIGAILFELVRGTPPAIGLSMLEVPPRTAAEAAALACYQRLTTVAGARPATAGEARAVLGALLAHAASPDDAPLEPAVPLTELTLPPRPSLWRRAWWRVVRWLRRPPRDVKDAAARYRATELESHFAELAQSARDALASGEACARPIAPSGAPIALDWMGVAYADAAAWDRGPVEASETAHALATIGLGVSLATIAVAGSLVLAVAAMATIVPTTCPRAWLAYLVPAGAIAILALGGAAVAYRVRAEADPGPAA